MRTEKKIRDMFYFVGVSDLTFQGNGTVDGQGYMWWVREFIQRNTHGRPKLMEFHQGRNLHFSGIRWIDSPSFHFVFKDIDNLYMHDMEIHVDYKGQLEINKLLLGNNGYTEGGKTLPWFPLNTDGIDLHGTNILLERINVTNFDDAVAVKSCNKNYQIAQCTENVVVRDMEIWFGVGLSIGSIPADDAYNCVNNITFSNSKFHHPLKAIYVKTNPGVTTSMLPGSGGKITNVLYENLEIFRPIWWTIYIGPQQQNQPGPSDDPGCLLYPLVPCDTQPLVDVKNITLRNIQSYGSLLPPGIIRCNSTNPCTGFVFENVKAHGWWRIFGLNYIVENVEGTVIHSKPDPGFKSIGASQLPAEEFKFGQFVEENVYPLIASMLDNASFSRNQAKIGHGYNDVVQSYTQAYGYLTK